jgi:hypothetical protein
LIIALMAQLEAERQTRERLRVALRSGTLDPVALKEIVEEPGRATDDEIASLERSIALRGAPIREEPRGEDWR